MVILSYYQDITQPLSVDYNYLTLVPFYEKWQFSYKLSSLRVHVHSLTMYGFWAACTTDNVVTIQYVLHYWDGPLILMLEIQPGVAGGAFEVGILADTPDSLPT